MKKILPALVFLLTLQNLLFALDAAPDFTLEGLDAKAVSLEEFKGQPLILFFWTSWCPYCRRELKKLNKLYPELKKEGWQVLSINIGEPAYKVSNILESYNLAYPVLLDRDADVAETYAVLGIPTYVIIDKKGNIRFQDNYLPPEYKDFLS